MMCSNSYLNHYIKVGQLPKCVISSIEMADQPLAKRAVSSAKICNLIVIELLLLLLSIEEILFGLIGRLIWRNQNKIEFSDGE